MSEPTSTASKRNLALPRLEGDFKEDDLVFLQGAANILGMAIDRQRTEAYLRQALERHEILLKEINHRVNNSLQLVAGMLHLQSSAAQHDDVRHQLNAASSRIAQRGIQCEGLLSAGCLSQARPNLAQEFQNRRRQDASREGRVENQIHL